MARQTLRLCGGRSRAARTIFIGDSCRGDFQEGQDTRFEFGGSKLEHLGQREGVRDVEFTRRRAAEGGEVRAATQFLAKVVSDAAHISSLRASQPKLSERL